MGKIRQARVFQGDEHLTPGTQSAGSGFHALVWQLRSNTLTLKDGHVTPLASMLVDASVKVMATVLYRANQINQIIDAEELRPVDLEELKEMFTELENKNEQA